MLISQHMGLTTLDVIVIILGTISIPYIVLCDNYMKYNTSDTHHPILYKRFAPNIDVASLITKYDHNFFKCLWFKIISHH